jgi:molybdenum cofactor cytidylyltransferase
MPDLNPTSGLAMKLGAVVLAAGASYRMGGAKQFLEVEGRPLLVRTLDAVARSGAHPIAVVLGANAGAIRTLIDESSVMVVINPDWASGMASSIRSGISALIAEAPALEAVLVTPCDQPALTADVIRQLVELNRRTGLIAAARYNGRVGAPAVFGSRHLGAIMALKGDEGARRLLNSGPLEVATADLPELGFDIDTPADYAAWKAKHG